MDIGENRSRIDKLGLIAMLGVGVFAVMVALTPLVKEGYSPHDAISNAAVGEVGYLQTIAFFALGLGSLALAWGLWQVLDGRSARIGVVLLGLGWGVTVIVAGIFRTDPTDEPETLSGTIHIAASLLGDVSGLVGILMLTLAFRKGPGWRSLWPLSMVLWGLALIGFIATGIAQEEDWWGIPQRIYVGIVVVWLVLTARHLRARSTIPAV